MAAVDRRAIELAGGANAGVAILPTAAAPDHNHVRAGGNGERWFRSLGARRVEVVPVIDRQSADDPTLASRLSRARLIYILGGFPGYVVSTLAGSRCWQAVLDAWSVGAIVGGSSAGAMAVCGHLYDPYQRKLIAALNLLEDTCFLPHYNSFGRDWAAVLRQQLPGSLLIGVDERTGLLNDGPEGSWQVYGTGSAVLHPAGGEARTYRQGEIFHLR